MNAAVKTGLKFAAVGALGFGLMAAALTPTFEAQAHKITSQQRTISQQKTDIGNAIEQRDTAQANADSCSMASIAYKKANGSFVLALGDTSTALQNLLDQPTFDTAEASMVSNLGDAKKYIALGDSATCK